MPHPRTSRRQFILAAAAGLVLTPARAADDPLAALEAQTGGRLGVYAYRIGEGEVLSNRATERFAMCSTFKAALAGMVLDRIARGDLAADRVFDIDSPTRISYSPTIDRRTEAGIGTMSLLGLCDSVVRVSDNTAANILLELVGGPQGFSRWAQSRVGSDDIRLDRMEPELNENAPGDPRDTTTPKAMAKLLGSLLYGGGIAEPAAAQLRAMMIDCWTGTQRLRAGLPAGVVAGDKTGTSGNGLVGDVGFFHRPGGRPVLIACYLDAPGLPTADANALHKAVAAEAAKVFL